MKVLPGPTKSNQVLVWSPDGRFVVAAGSGDGITAWDVTAGTPGRRVLNAGHGGRFMQFCPRTGRLCVAFATGGFWHWDPHTGEERQSPRPGHSTNFYGVALSADGRTVVADHYLNATRTIVGYAVGESGLSESWARDNSRWNDVQSFAFRPGTDELFGLGTHTGSPRRFEWIRPRAGEVVGSFELPYAQSDVRRWVLSPDGERVAWMNSLGIYLRRLDAPATLVLPAAEGEIRRGLAFHPGGWTLAYATGTTVRFLDADTFAEVRAFDWGTGKVRAVAFSPDGLRAAISGEGGKGWVTVFDLE